MLGHAAAQARDVTAHPGAHTREALLLDLAEELLSIAAPLQPALLQVGLERVQSSGTCRTRIDLGEGTGLNKEPLAEQVGRGERDLKKGCGYLHESPGVRYRFVRQHLGRFSVAALCRAMQVTRSGYYAWRRRKPSERQKQNQTLLGQIRTFFERSKQTYGSPRILRDLRQAGFACGRHRVARLMRQSGLRAVVAPRFRTTTNSRHQLPVAANLLDRDFAAPAANRKWASDIT